MLNSQELINKVKSYNKFLNPEKLTKAYDFAIKAHKNQKRDSGDPYSNHPIAVANILTELKLDSATIATGLLPICFGQATKVSKYLIESSKTYRVTAKLGTKTTTGDSEGSVLEKTISKSLQNETIEEVLKLFIGNTEQKPQRCQQSICSIIS